MFNSPGHRDSVARGTSSVCRNACWLVVHCYWFLTKTTPCSHITPVAMTIGSQTRRTTFQNNPATIKPGVAVNCKHLKIAHPKVCHFLGNRKRPLEIRNPSPYISARDLEHRTLVSASVVKWIGLRTSILE